MREKKTGKARRVTLNKACIEAIQKLLDSHDYRDDEQLFIGKRGPLTVPTVNRLVKQRCKSINLKGN